MGQEKPQHDRMLERIGLTIDKADNYLALQEAQLPVQMRIDSLTKALRVVREDLRRLYFDLGGTDVWS